MLCKTLNQLAPAYFSAFLLFGTISRTDL